MSSGAPWLKLILQATNEVRRAHQISPLGVIRKVRRLNLRSALFNNAASTSAKLAVLVFVVILSSPVPEVAAGVAGVVVEVAEEGCRPSEAVWLLYAVA